MVGCSPARQAWARPLRQVATARGKRGRCGPRSRRWRGGRRMLLTIRGPGGPSGRRLPPCPLHPRFPGLWLAIHRCRRSGTENKGGRDRTNVGRRSHRQ